MIALVTLVCRECGKPLVAVQATSCQHGNPDAHDHVQCHNQACSVYVRYTRHDKAACLLPSDLVVRATLSDPQVKGAVN